MDPIPAQAKSPTITELAYAFVETMIAKCDGCVKWHGRRNVSTSLSSADHMAADHFPWWHGWALREAYEAGAKAGAEAMKEAAINEIWADKDLGEYPLPWHIEGNELKGDVPRIVARGGEPVPLLVIIDRINDARGAYTNGFRAGIERAAKACLEGWKDENGVDDAPPTVAYLIEVEIRALLDEPQEPPK